SLSFKCVPSRRSFANGWTSNRTINLSSLRCLRSKIDLRARCARSQPAPRAAIPLIANGFSKGLAHAAFEIPPQIFRDRLLARLCRRPVDAASCRHLPDGSFHGRAIFRRAGGLWKGHCVSKAAEGDRADRGIAFSRTNEE